MFSANCFLRPFDNPSKDFPNDLFEYAAILFYSVIFFYFFFVYRKHSCLLKRIILYASSEMSTKTFEVKSILSKRRKSVAS